MPKSLSDATLLALSKTVPDEVADLIVQRVRETGEDFDEADIAALADVSLVESFFRIANSRAGIAEKCTSAETLFQVHHDHLEKNMETVILRLAISAAKEQINQQQTSDANGGDEIGEVQGHA